MEFIRDLLWLWVLGAVSGTGYILYAVLIRDAAPRPAARGKVPPSQVVTTRRTPVAPPIAKPAGAPLPTRTPVVPVPPAPPAGGEHQRRGSAPTVKLPSAEPDTDRLTPRAPVAATPAAPSADDAAAADLFGGLAAARVQADNAPTPVPAPAPAPKTTPRDMVDKAGRIEEYGFHVGSKAAVESGPRAAAETKPAPAPVEPAPGQPRTQTQELDDILKRIDAVLLESNSPAAEATQTNPQQTSAGQATLQVPTPPPTEKPERNKATDPNQQKLF